MNHHIISDLYDQNIYPDNLTKFSNIFSHIKQQYLNTKHKPIKYLKKYLMFCLDHAGTMLQSWFFLLGVCGQTITVFSL